MIFSAKAIEFLCQDVTRRDVPCADADILASTSAAVQRQSSADAWYPVLRCRQCRPTPFCGVKNFTVKGMSYELCRLGLAYKTVS